MTFPDFFADAESNFDDSEFIIFGIPYDKTCSFQRGAEKAPREIRQASWNFETFDFKTGVDLGDIKFHDYGDLNVSNLEPKQMVEMVKKFALKIIAECKFPIAIGGEHSITTGIIQAFPKDIAVLSLDAHMDYRDQYEKDSNNHACVIRRIVDHIPVENIAVVGIRSAEKEEYNEAKKHNLFYIDSYDIYNNGIKNAIAQTKKYLADKKVYLTVDIDVIDPAYAPGTSNPEPFGLTPLEIIDCIDSFATQLIGFDLVEVCPPFDTGQTSSLAAKFIRHVIDRVWFNNKR